MKRRLVLLSLVSLMFLGTACDDKVAGEKAADLLNTVDKVRLKLNLKDSEGLVISNQNVEIGMEIDSYATARDNYFGDLNYSELYFDNIAFYNKYDPHTGCNPYIGRRFKVDGYDLVVKYNTPPTVLYTTKINANTQVDSKGRINKTFFLSDGESTSSAFRDTCTLNDVYFDDILSMLLTVKVKTSEVICNSYCGIQVKTYCSKHCESGSTHSSSYYWSQASSYSSCTDSCSKTETPYCQETCKEKTHILAEASVYAEDILERADPTAENLKNLENIQNGGSGSITINDSELNKLIIDRKKSEAVLDAELTLEAYRPLNY